MLVLIIGVAAAFRTAFLPHTTKPSVASKLAQTNHPVAVVPPQWLPVLLAANTTPGPPTNHRLLDNTFASKAELEKAVGEYNADVNAAEAKYGPINNWDVSGITDMSYLFKDLGNFNADISRWDTSGVTSMSGMFAVSRICTRCSVTNMYLVFRVRSTRLTSLTSTSAVPVPCPRSGVEPCPARCLHRGRPPPLACQPTYLALHGMPLLSTLGRARRRSTSR